MRKILCAANWKLNKGPRETKEFLIEFLEGITPEEQKSFAIFPPTINLLVMSELLKETSIAWGAQNICFENSGAYTGENSAKEIKALGGHMCLIGHSERRILFSEKCTTLSKKIQLMQELNMIPILCLGEKSEERAEGITKQVVENQLRAATELADWSKPLILAYEPVWAIGTGQVASPEQAEDVHQFLRSCINDWVGPQVAEQMQILYGGSVKPTNSRELFTQPNIDGFLIGGASLSPKSLTDIYRNTIQ